jgi:hypothetical protein
MSSSMNDDLYADHPSAYPWVGSPRYQGEHTDDVLRLIENRARVRVLGGWSDPDAEWSYDEIALVELDGDYYALTTSGCSCPSPSETWCVDFGPATLAELRDWCARGSHADALLPYLA